MLINLLFISNIKKGYPEFVEEQPDCTYVFEWRTSVACVGPATPSVPCGAVDSTTGYQYDLSLLATSDWEAVSVLCHIFEALS